MRRDRAEFAADTDSLLMLKQKNTKKQGDVGVGVAIAWATMRGIVVSIPLTDSQAYDLVFDMKDQLSKIQVKTTRFKNSNGNYTCDLRTKGGNKSGQKSKKPSVDDFDFLFVLTDEGHTYLIPRKELGDTSVTLCRKYEKFLESSGSGNPNAL